jgi:hypothetical protein
MMRTLNLKNQQLAPPAMDQVLDRMLSSPPTQQPKHAPTKKNTRKAK